MQDIIESNIINSHHFYLPTALPMKPPSVENANDSTPTNRTLKSPTMSERTYVKSRKLVVQMNNATKFRWWALNKAGPKPLGSIPKQMTEKESALKTRKRPKRVLSKEDEDERQPQEKNKYLHLLYIKSKSERDEEDATCD